MILDRKNILKLDTKVIKKYLEDIGLSLGFEVNKKGFRTETKCTN